MQMDSYLYAGFFHDEAAFYPQGAVPPSPELPFGLIASPGEPAPPFPPPEAPRPAAFQDYSVAEPELLAQAVGAGEPHYGSSGPSVNMRVVDALGGVGGDPVHDQTMGEEWEEEPRRQRQQQQQQPADAEDTFAANYGDVPVEEIQSKAISGRLWTKIGDLDADAAGRSVLIRGATQAIRPVSKKMAFVVLRQSMSTVQCVLVASGVLVASADAGVSTQMVRFATALSKESIVDVEGVVSLPKEPLKATTQQVRSTCILLCNLLMQFLSSESNKPVLTDLMRISMFILLLP